MKLNVKFPGELSFQFKNSNSFFDLAQLYHDLNKKFPITAGTSTVNDGVEFPL